MVYMVGDRRYVMNGLNKEWNKAAVNLIRLALPPHGKVGGCYSRHSTGKAGEMIPVATCLSKHVHNLDKIILFISKPVNIILLHI